MKISNLELAIIFYIMSLLIFDFTYLAFITSGSYVFFNILEITRKRR